MNLSILFKVPDFLRKGHAFVDEVKSGKQAGIVASLGALLACIAPFVGGQIDVHPWLAFFFTQDGIQAVGAAITGIAAVAYHIGSSPERGILAPKPDAGQAREPAAPAAPPAPAEQVDSALPHSDDPTRDMPLGG